MRKNFVSKTKGNTKKCKEKVGLKLDLGNCGKTKIFVT